MLSQTQVNADFLQNVIVMGGVLQGLNLRLHIHMGSKAN